MADEPVHLIERVAERLRGGAGLTPAPAMGAPFQTFVDQTFVDQSGVDQPGVDQPGVDRPGVDQPGPQAAPADAAAIPAAPIQAAPIQAAPTARNAPAIVTMSTLTRAGMVIGGRRARPSEEYRITAANILRSMPQRATAGSNLLMITSPKPGEGKSFSALNLAASVVQNGLGEALLIDADPKLGSVSSILGLGDRLGLFDIANDPAIAADDVIVRTEFPGLAVVPLGSNRILQSQTGITRPVAAAIERIGQRFSRQVVIVDVSPCLATSDPSMLAPLVGQIVMVIEAERTQRDSLAAALNLVKTCPCITLLLNKAQLATTHSFGDYDYYGA